MIVVDRNRGSGELLEPLSKKMPCVLDGLPSGDFAFEGNYEGGRGLIGVERKKITNDFITCMFDHRFTGFQLTEMVDYYKVIYLLIEGMYRPNKDTGVLEFWSNGGWVSAQRGRDVLMYDHIHHHILTIQHKTPALVERTSTPTETVQVLKSLYGYHNDKPWDQHRSHLGLHKAPKPGQAGLFVRPPLRQVVSCDFPGISWERSLAVKKEFPTTESMVNASVEAWRRVEGIGKGIATKVHDLIRSE